ncbi:MAG: PD-(D/E)XK nuclease family protein [Archangium sp.]|nr:PD-(D/E)XK nuclease family protein [Archangium sp.]
MTLPPSGDVLLVGPSFETVAELTRSLHRALFGWRRTTLYRCALELARPALLEQKLTAVTSLSLEALWARVAHQLGGDELLHRLAPLEGRPGLSRALARTVGELRMLGIAPEAVEPALGEAMRAFQAALAEGALADRSMVYSLAREAVVGSVKSPLVLLDVRFGPGLEQDFVEAMVRHAPNVFAAAPVDELSVVEALEVALGVKSEALRNEGDSALDALQGNLFSPLSAPGKAREHKLEDFFSAPGEARECVEIARRMIELARTGVRFDEMAVLLRSPGTYRAPLEDAFRRARIPAWFSSGLPRPDPSGRALLALLHCAEEGLSARRFSEYLSLSQVPRLEESGAPPAAATDRFFRPDATESLLPLTPNSPEVPAAAEVVGDVEAPSVLGQLRSPRKWERLIIDAAVIGGTDRWKRRLSGLRQKKRKERQNPTATEAQLQRVDRDLADLDALEHFALPLLEALAELPKAATWKDWLDHLGGLATRALKSPQRVLAVLHELAPMAPIGPLELPEVRAVLTQRLSEVTEPPDGRRQGRVLIAPVDAARGLSFGAVFIPGLAERVFPQKIREDPLMPDGTRLKVSAGLETSKARIASERLALQLAVGAARGKAILSYPRVDAEHARPRVPSFYALEAARAVQGSLPGFEALQRQAESSSRIRLAWPAPDEPSRAIDDTEFDLAMLDRILRSREPVKGHGRYLVKTNLHLARALRARYARWQQSTWTAHDGLVKPGALGRAALEAHQPAVRPFSPTALEQYAACPYRFFLSAIVRLQPMEIPGELEELGPLEKGSMAHQAHYELLSALRKDGVEITEATLPAVLERLHATVEHVSQEVFDQFKPAIERVWEDGVQTLEADLREWVKKVSKDTEFKPAHFELSFGLPGRDVDSQDPASSPSPVTLTEGLQVRGSIDLVEKSASGALRATDYKTGRARAEPGNVIGGGRHLQPVLYALVLEKLFPGVVVKGGRLFYTTQIGGFLSVPTALDAASREAFGLVARTIRSALETGFFPAAPEEGECRYCNFRAVCGPDEERRLVRTRKGLRAELKDLRTLRAMP